MKNGSDSSTESVKQRQVVSKNLEDIAVLVAEIRGLEDMSHQFSKS